MNDKLLDEKQAYKAMFYFLENYYFLTSDNTIGGILGSMQLLNDGKPADPAFWADWEIAIKKVRNETSQ